MTMHKDIYIDFKVPLYLEKYMEKANKAYEEKGGDSIDYILATDDIEGIAKSLYLQGYFTYEQADLILYKYGM